MTQKAKVAIMQVEKVAMAQLNWVVKSQRANMAMVEVERVANVQVDRV
jgi:hypothetical protein